MISFDIEICYLYISYVVSYLSLTCQQIKQSTQAKKSVFESAAIFLVFDIESHASEINKLVKGNDA